MSDFYAIVYCGYEGIDHVVWIGEGEELVKARIHAYREKVKGFARYKDMNFGNRIRKKLGMFAEFDGLNPDRFCVMGYVDGESLPQCVCDKLGVNPDKAWLM